MAAKRKFTFASLIVRLGASLLLVFSTYNASGYSLYHWLVASDNAPMSLKALALIALTILYYALLRVVFAAFRRSGMIAASLVSILISLLLLPITMPDSASPEGSAVLAAQYAGPLALALVMTFGMSWSHMIQRLTGQLQKRYVR